MAPFLTTTLSGAWTLGQNASCRSGTRCAVLSSPSFLPALKGAAHDPSKFFHIGGRWPHRRRRVLVSWGGSGEGPAATARALHPSDRANPADRPGRPEPAG